MIAERLADATGPVARDRPGARVLARRRRGRRPLRPAPPTARFIDALRAALRPDFAFEEVDAHVDDPAFADLVADRYLTLVKEPAHAG